MSRRSTVVVAGLAVAVMVVVALVLGRTHGGSPAAFVRDGPVVAAVEESDVGPMAIAGGTFRIVDGCAQLDGAAVVWPVGTTWDQDEEAVVLSDGSLVHQGHAVEASGGYSSEKGEAARMLGKCLVPGREVAFIDDPIADSPRPVL